MNIFKKQGTAWVITGVMILLAIFIGIGKGGPGTVTPGPNPPASAEGYYVYDEAQVLSSSDIKKLSRVNEELADDLGVVVACVTTNYGRSDLGDFALRYADQIGLEGYDFIVVLDISGDNYWLVQGADLRSMISDNQCGDYAWDYMEKPFARGDYGQALIDLQDALADWYHDHA